MRDKRPTSKTRSSKEALIRLFSLCWLISLARHCSQAPSLSTASWMNPNGIARVGSIRRIYPLSLAEPKHTQKVLILEDEKGMYFGFISDQAKETVRTNQHQRDNERANSDKVGVSIDFDGDGLTGYGFSVSAGGSITDTIYRNENQGNTDWDADWESATFVDEEAWFAEVFIPWTVAPMKAVTGPTRTINVAFWRMVISEGRANTSIPGNPRQEKFLSLLHPFHSPITIQPKSTFSLCQCDSRSGRG